MAGLQGQRRMRLQLVLHAQVVFEQARVCHQLLLLQDSQRAAQTTAAGNNHFARRSGRAGLQSQLLQLLQQRATGQQQHAHSQEPARSSLQGWQSVSAKPAPTVQAA